MKTKVCMFALATFVLFMISCSSNELDVPDVSSEVQLLSVADDGVSTFVLNNVCPVFTVTDPLTTDEIEFIYAVREDEKLAHNLYIYFVTQYPTARQLANIGNAEINHITTIERVFTYYEIDFPTLGQPGVFTDENRQAIYTRLTAQGSTLHEAYQVMAALEEENIVIYSKVASELTNPNLQLIINNLAQSSENHFKVLVNQITAWGSIYTPTLLEASQYEEILDSVFQPGNCYGMQGQNSQNTNSSKGNGKHGNKGSVNNTGTCTGSTNGNIPGQGNHAGGQGGKGYRGGK